MVNLIGWKLFVNEKEVIESSEYYERLTKEGPFVNGDHGEHPNQLQIQWLNLELIQKGQEFVRRNFFGVLFAHFISLMMIFTFKSGRAVLLRTGESHSRHNSTSRYLSTILHIKLWYESDFTKFGEKGGKDVYSVRKIHGMAAKNYPITSPPLTISLDNDKLRLLEAMKSDVSSLSEGNAPWRILSDKPVVPMSQFDMVVTQFCFLGFIVLHPQVFGIWDSNGIEGFIHIWAVLGKLLGIEDRFNLALHFKDKRGYWDLWTNIFIPDLKEVDEAAMAMWDALIYGLGHYTPFLRLKSVIYFMTHDVTLVDKKSRKEIFGVMTSFDKLCYFAMISILYLLKWNPIRLYMNLYQRFWIYYGRLFYLWSGVHMAKPDEV